MGWRGALRTWRSRLNIGSELVVCIAVVADLAKIFNRLVSTFGNMCESKKLKLNKQTFKIMKWSTLKEQELITVRLNGDIELTTDWVKELW